MENKNINKTIRTENDFHCHLDMKQFSENAEIIIGDFFKESSGYLITVQTVEGKQPSQPNMWIKPCSSLRTSLGMCREVRVSPNRKIGISLLRRRVS